MIQDLGSELLTVLNTVMAALAAIMNLWGALRTNILVRRVSRFIVVIGALYVGAIYTAYLLELIDVIRLGSQYLRPILLLFLSVLAVLPAIDLLDPVERLRLETQQVVTELRIKYDLLQEQTTLILNRLAEAQTEVKRLRDEIAVLSSSRHTTTAPSLLVAVGSMDLDVDLAGLRRVSRESGLAFVRLAPTTFKQLERKLERDRAKGKPVRWLHISAHANQYGVEFTGGVAEWGDLSEILDGVQVLVLASCHSDWGSDELGVVPYVISFSEEIENRDASIFAEHFWLQMSKGLDIDTALDIALERCPPVIREFIERSW